MGWAAERPVSGQFRLPIESGPQQALLLGCSELLDVAPEVFTQVVTAAKGQLPLIGLLNHPSEYLEARAALQERGISEQGLRFVLLPHDTMWIRDYGPQVVLNREGEAAFIDASYSRILRPRDDQVPELLARKLAMPLITSPLQIEGGDLLGNGDGLLVITTRLLESNAGFGVNESGVRQELKRLFGADEVLVLEPLSGEPTGHVDMFLTFAAPDVAVLAHCPPGGDPENFAVLERNAALLAGVKTRRGPLQVYRVPMPVHDDFVWRTYTNVVYANQTVLVPTYADREPSTLTPTLDLYRQLLPGKRIVGIDAERLARQGGALHCIVMNLAWLGGDQRLQAEHRKLMEGAKENERQEGTANGG